MVRSLWTGAAGMNAQQVNVDTIANNLANVNTTGYKSQQAQFKSLLYQTLQTKATNADGTPKPVSSEIGLGVRPSSINSNFNQGSLLASNSTTAFAIQGDGFFAVNGADGNTYYTRNGDFNWSIAANGGMMLCTTEGYPVLSSNGRAITMPRAFEASRITINSNGEVCYPDGNNNPTPVGITIGLFQFRNPNGLERQGDSLWAQTESSGEAINEARNANVQPSQIVQGYLEGSNVSVADEMVNLIVAQRAYESNSKVITTSDTMMELANNLKR